MIQSYCIHSLAPISRHFTSYKKYITVFINVVWPQLTLKDVKENV